MLCLCISIQALLIHFGTRKHPQTHINTCVLLVLVLRQLSSMMWEFVSMSSIVMEEDGSEKWGIPKELYVRVVTLADLLE